MGYVPPAAADARYVFNAGDEMSGSLVAPALTAKAGGVTLGGFQKWAFDNNLEVRGTGELWLTPETTLVLNPVNKSTVIHGAVSLSPGWLSTPYTTFTETGHDFGGLKLSSLGDPVSGKDGANKDYADTKVAKAGDTMTGPLIIQQAGPGAGQAIQVAQVRSNSSFTGYLVFTFPPGYFTSTMMALTIKGYDYAAPSGEWQVDLGGYLYQATPNWMNTSSRMQGKLPGGQRSLTVRFLVKGTANNAQYAIAIGEASTVWTYPTIVANLMTGFTGAPLATLPGYSLAVSASLSGWSTSVTETPEAYLGMTPGEVRQFSLTTQAIATSTWTILSPLGPMTGDTGDGIMTFSNSNTVTLTEAGYYDWSIYYNWNTNTTGQRYVALFDSGTEAIRSSVGPNTAGVGTDTFGMNSQYFAAGDYLTIRVWQNSGVSLNFSNGRFFIRRVGV